MNIRGRQVAGGLFSHANLATEAGNDFKTKHKKELSNEVHQCRMYR
jgi:hypothetical protein